MPITSMDICWAVTKRVMRYAGSSSNSRYLRLRLRRYHSWLCKFLGHSNLPCQLPRGRRFTSRVKHSKSIYLVSPPPRLPSTLPRGAAVSFRVLRPAYRRRGFVGTTRRAVRVAHRRVHRHRASASPRVAARVEFVRPEEEPIGSSEGGYSDATRDGSLYTIAHVDPR